MLVSCASFLAFSQVLHQSSSPDQRFCNKEGDTDCLYSTRRQLKNDMAMAFPNYSNNKRWKHLCTTSLHDKFLNS